MNDGAFFHEEDTLAKLQRRLNILLDQQNGDTTLIDAMDLASNLGDKSRHDALGRFVENDELRPHHQAARDGEHLLLTARQGISGLLEPLLEPREAAEDIVLARR